MTKEFRNWAFWSCLAFKACQIVRIVFLVRHVHRKRKGNLWLNCQFSRKNVYISMWVTVYNFWQPEILFPSLNEGINCKTFLRLYYPKELPVIYSMEQTTLARQCLNFFGFFPICNNISPIILQSKWFFSFIKRPWFLGFLWATDIS